MEAATLSVILQAQDNASPVMNNFSKTVQGAKAPTQSLTTTLTTNRAAFRELAMGVTYLGTSFLGMGVALKSVNNPMAQNLSNVLMIAGGFMTAIGSAVQFISAISKTVDALKKLAIAEAVVKAFQGPAGWAALGIGAAVAVGATVGISKLSSSENKASHVTINNNIQGSVVTEKQIADNVRKQIVLTQNRNNTSGIK